MTWQRARSPEQKAARCDAIIDAAAGLFDEASLDGISMNALAARAGMGKASLYGYFPTKEHVFLKLFQREGDSWISDVISNLDALGESDPATVARVIAATSVSHDRLCRLAIVLHTVLDNFSNTEARRDFKLYMLEPIDHFASSLQTTLPCVSHEDATRFFMQHHALIVGLWPFGYPREADRDFYEDERLQVFLLDFPTAFENSLRAILTQINS